MLSQYTYEKQPRRTRKESDEDIDENVWVTSQEPKTHSFTCEATEIAKKETTFVYFRWLSIIEGGNI